MVANPGPNWHAIGPDGGGSDILLQNTSGQTAIWDMTGTNITGSGAVSANAGPNWRAVGLDLIPKDRTTPSTSMGRREAALAPDRGRLEPGAKP